jgi:hypothetical protein
MKYILAKPDSYIVGLPARDLDDKELNAEQKALLEDLVDQGVFVPADQKKIKRGEISHESENSRTESARKEAPPEGS